MTLTPNGKDYIAQHFGASNCFAASGVQYKDPTGTTQTGSTMDAVSTIVVFGGTGMGGETTANITTANGGNSVTSSDINWIGTNGGSPISTGHYCVSSMTQNAKNYIAQHFGVSNCFAANGVQYKDPSGTTQTGSTMDAVSTISVFGGTGMNGETASSITTANGGTPLSSIDINWIGANGGSPSGNGTYCATIIPTPTPTPVPVTPTPTPVPTTPTPTPSPPVLTEIVVYPQTVTVLLGGSQTFTAVPYDQYSHQMTGIAITWSSSDTTVGTIGSSSGIFTASSTKTGNTIITATSGSISGTATVTVSLAPAVLTSITISPQTVSVMLGGYQIFTAVPKDQYGNQVTGVTISWSSSDTTVGTISSSTGIFTASSTNTGTATITATSGSISGTATVTVTAIPPELALILVSPKSTSIIVGGKAELTAVPYDQHGNQMSDITIVWSSSDPLTGSVSPTVGTSTTITGIRTGTVTITASSGSINSTMTATITPAPPQTGLVILASLASFGIAAVVMHKK